MSTTSYRKEALHHKIHRHARSHIHNMRQKSDTHKKIYSFVVAFILTFIVFMLWYFLSLPKIMNNYYTNKAEMKRLNEKPLNKFKNIFSGKVTDLDTNNIEIKQ